MWGLGRLCPSIASAHLPSRQARALARPTGWARLVPLVALLCACASSSPATVAVPEAPPPPMRSLPDPGEPRKKAGPATMPESEDPENPSDTQMSAWAAGRRGWLGVELEPSGPDEVGVRVLRVIPKSPADAAGVRDGDLLVRLDNDAVELPREVVHWVSRRPSGTRVGLMVKRAGKDRLLAVKLGAFPENDQLVRMTFVGQPAPPFEFLKTAQGNVSPTLGAHKGKVTVIEFWAPWCVACRALIPHLNEWHEQYSARGLRVLGITSEPLERAALISGQLGMHYPVLSDETGRTTRLYHARAVPMVFVIDRQGTVREVMVGYDSQKLVELDRLVRQLLAE